MQVVLRSVLWAVLALAQVASARAAERHNLVKNPDFEQPGADLSQAAHFILSGDAARQFAGTAYEFSTMGIALDSARDLNGDGQRAGSVAQDVPIDETLPGRWFRFKIRGLPEQGFVVAGDDLHLKVDFFADRGGRPLDAVTRKLYALIEQERRDLGVNGVGRKGGAATWKTYALEFRLPFPDIDQVRLSVGFRGGKGTGKASFFVDEFSLEPITAPADAPEGNKIQPATAPDVDTTKLVPLGGRWFYLPAAAENTRSLVVNDQNADRLVFQEGHGRYVNPFAENMSAWLRKGYLDVAGTFVDEDRFRPDNVTIRFDANSMIVNARNLPNHPTARFPSPPGSGDRNPSYIQEHDYTYHIPLVPEPNPGAISMDRNNANRALKMGAIGIAVNGVVFYNPFDAGMTDATDLMDRCCGHPSPDNRYHYHKYPVCVKSPFADEGKEHSPVIGWAFDGFPIYGPYEARSLMAKDSKENPLNGFNVHRDSDRGWHYHVTPGKFPYIIGGYWGKFDPRNAESRPRGGGPMAGPGPGGPGGFRPPPHPVMIALDRDDDHSLSASEIAAAADSLRTLDRDHDGVLSVAELRPGLPPGPPPGFDRPPPGPNGPAGGFRPPPLPALLALDRDHNHALSANEIADAPRALKTLDRDSDGTLSPDELRPPPPGGGAPSGRARPDSP